MRLAAVVRYILHDAHIHPPYLPTPEQRGLGRHGAHVCCLFMYSCPRPPSRVNPGEEAKTDSFRGRSSSYPFLTRIDALTFTAFAVGGNREAGGRDSCVIFVGTCTPSASNCGNERRARVPESSERADRVCRTCCVHILRSKNSFRRESGFEMVPLGPIKMRILKLARGG